MSDDDSMLDGLKSGKSEGHLVAQGLTILSLEGNTLIGDNGAKWIADMIKKPNNNTK